MDGTHTTRGQLFGTQSSPLSSLIRSFLSSLSLLKPLSAAASHVAAKTGGAAFPGVVTEMRSESHTDSHRFFPPSTVALFNVFAWQS